MLKPIKIFNDNTRELEQHYLDLSSIEQLGPPILQYGASGSFRTRKVIVRGGRYFFAEDSEDLQALAV